MQATERLQKQQTTGTREPKSRQPQEQLLLATPSAAEATDHPWASPKGDWRSNAASPQTLTTQFGRKNHRAAEDTEKAESSLPFGVARPSWAGGGCRHTMPIAVEFHREDASPHHRLWWGEHSGVARMTEDRNRMKRHLVAGATRPAGPGHPHMG